MATIPIEEAQNSLKELVHSLAPGEEIVITENHQVVARLIGEPVKTREPRMPGTLQGTVTSMAPDFNGPLEDFKESME